MPIKCRANLLECTARSHVQIQICEPKLDPAKARLRGHFDLAQDRRAADRAGVEGELKVGHTC